MRFIFLDEKILRVKENCLKQKPVLSSVTEIMPYMYKPLGSFLSTIRLGELGGRGVADTGIIDVPSLAKNMRII